MLKTTKSTTLTGQSVIAVNGTDTIVVSMSANISENGNYPSISKTIQNKELYLTNKDVCREDISAFDDVVDSVIGGADEN